MASTRTRISIKSNYRDSQNHSSFMIRCHKHRVFTTVTTKPSVVRGWLYKVITTYRHHLLRNRLIVGLGVLCAPHIPHSPAVLTLCVGRYCLLFQLGLAAHVPISIRRFLSRPSNKFVGVWNHKVVPMLEDCIHNLKVPSLVDLRHVAADRRGTPRQISTEQMAEVILGFHEVGMDFEMESSNWSADWLSYDQVIYASVDVFLSFQLGKDLKTWNWNNNVIRKPDPVYSVDNGRGDVGFERSNNINDAFALVVEPSSGGEPSSVDEYDFVDNDNGYEASPRPRLSASDDDEDDDYYLVESDMYNVSIKK